MEKAAIGKAGAGAGGNKSAAEEEYFTESGELGGKDDDWLGTHVESDGGPNATSGSGAAARVGDIEDIPDDVNDSTAPASQLTAREEDDLVNRMTGAAVGSSQQVAAGHDDDDILPEDIGDIPDIPDEDDLDHLGAGVEEAEDPAARTTPIASSSSVATSSNSSAKPAAFGAGPATDGGNLINVRTYDCLITYDKYYQTPRMWLVGYDEHGRLLKSLQIFEDVSSDYAQKTVTIEPFPHSATMSTASVHPCKHASVMKKVIERMNASVVEVQRKAKKDKKKVWGIGGAVRKVVKSSTDSSPANATGTPVERSGTPVETQQEGEETEVEGLRVDQYLIIFLKFMASIVPAIEIDATQAM